MATMRLVPSTYYLSSSNYLSVSSVSNMYADTDSTTHGTVTHGRASTSNTYYFYLRGFNFDDVPESAEVTGFSIKIKASATGHTTSTSTSYYMSLYNGTSAIGSTYADGRLTTSVDTFTFAEGSLTWESLSSYGSNFGIRVPLRRASSNTQDVVSIYGAEIEVTYTLPEPVTITSTLTGSGTIDPNGAVTMYKGEEYTIAIIPTDPNGDITVTNNGVDVTSQLEPPGTSTDETVLGDYDLVSGSFNGSGATYFSGIVGNGVDAAKTTSNYYSGGSGVIAVFTYDMPFVLPDDAVISRVWCEVNGHAESTSNSSEYMCAQLISGSTDLSEELNFKSIGTSNSTQTLEASPIPTVAQLAQMKLQCRLGYYGGAINGATAYVTFQSNAYTYTFITTGDATIAVILGEPPPQTIYYKDGGSWVAVSAVYKKVNGTWVLQSNLANVFESGVNYVKGN